MAQLNIGAIKDLGGIGGFTFTSGGITCNGTLNVTNIMIDGTIAGSSAFILPNPSGHAEEYISNNGSNLTWGNLSTASGVRSMQVWTGNGTWNKPESSVKTICVFCTGAGGGGCILALTQDPDSCASAIRSVGGEAFVTILCSSLH